MREWLVRRIRELLAAQPGMSARELAAAVEDRGVTKTEVNKVLHAQQDLFVKTDDTPPRWSLRAKTSAEPAPAGPAAERANARTANARTADPAATAAATATPGPAARTPGAGPAAPGVADARSGVPGSGRPDGASTSRTSEPLRAWQRQALTTWGEHGHRGVVVAVDGSGKTALGIAAAAEALEGGHPVLVVVPDTGDQQRWAAALHTALPSRSIVTTVGTAPSNGEITVVTASAAIQDRLFDKYAGNQPTALIVDDVHTYSAGAYAKALLPRFAWRLGLTSGLARPDDLLDTVVLPYFEHVLPGCDYLHAVQNGLLPRIRLAHVPLSLTEGERGALVSAESRAEQALDTLVGTYGAPDTPAGAAQFAREALRVRGHAAVFAKRYLDAVAKRDEILGGCQAKTTLLQTLPTATLRRTRAVLHTDQAAAANRTVQLLGRDGYRIARVGEARGAADRGDLARRLREGDLHAVVERRVLDPAEPMCRFGLGVFLSPDLTAPELALRLGRIIRSGGTHAPIVVLAFVAGSVEDPRRVGPHLRQLTHIAEEFVTTSAEGLPDLLDRWIPAAATEPGRAAAGASVTEHPTPHGDTTEPEPSTEPDEQEADSVTAELTAALRAEGGVATADELGDLIGMTDPREMFAAVSAAADSGRLEFQEIEPGSEELILLSADCGGTVEERRAAVARIAAWAVRSDDPIDEFARVVGDLAPIRVPGHRLVDIAAFLRGTTPAGLL